MKCPYNSPAVQTTSVTQNPERKKKKEEKEKIIQKQKPCLF